MIFNHLQNTIEYALWLKKNILSLQKIKIMTFEYWESRIYDVLNITTDEIKQRKRDTKTELARAMLWYILHANEKISITKIAERYDRRRRNVYYTIANIKFRIAKQKEYRIVYNEIINLNSISND